jgi:D-lactate dehydrogenase
MTVFCCDGSRFPHYSFMNCAIFDSKPYDREYLSRAAGSDIHLRFLDFRLGADTLSAAESCSAVCVFVNDRVDRPVVEALAKQGIRHIALRCAGFNNVDLEAAKENGITVTRVPAYSPYAVAEHTVALLMTLNRKIHRAYNRVREQNFSLNGLVGFDLHGKTVGIIGTGKIGRITAAIFRGFGCRVLAQDPYESAEWAAEVGVTYTSLDELLAASDIVSLHSPLFPETHHLLDEARLSRMKQGSYLINTSRGKLVDTAALIGALKSGHLGGVALDVYEEEEGIFFEDHSGHVLGDDVLARLLTFPNVLVTSHQAFLTTEALGEIARVTVENLIRISGGDAPLDGTSLG